MLAVLVLFAGAVATDAGNTYSLNSGFGLHHLRSPPRQILVKSQLASSIGFNPDLQSLVPTNSFFPSPVFNTGQFRHEGIRSLPNFYTSPIYRPSPISYGAIGPAPISYGVFNAPSITHILPHVVLKTTSIGNYPTSNFLSQGWLNPSPISHLRPAYVAPPQLAAFSSLQSKHAVIESDVINTQQASNPSIYSHNDNGHNGHDHHHVQVTQEVPNKSVSYSITNNDYNYLKQHKINGQDSPYNPILGFNTAAPNEKLQHENHHSHQGKTKDPSSDQKPSNSNLLRRSAAPNPVPSLSSSPVPCPSPSQVSNPTPVPAPSETHERSVKPSFSPVPEPLVFKHIYFHAPQPEFEEPPPVAPINLPPPKKNYNIVFIKAPSQEQHNPAYSQQVIQSRQPQIEEKTLIYVLSKKEDPVQVIPSISPQKPSSPEVFFVKYQTKFGNDITDPRNHITEEHFPESITEYSQKRSLEDKHKEGTVHQKSVS